VIKISQMGMLLMMMMMTTICDWHLVSFINLLKSNIRILNRPLSLLSLSYFLL